MLNGTLKTSGDVSLLTLAIIAYHRYIAIHRPLEYTRKITKRWIYILLSYLYSLTPVLIKIYQFETNYTSAISEDILRNESTILSIVFVFLPTCFCVIFCYCKTFLIACQHVNTIETTNNYFQKYLDRKMDRRDTKYAKTVATVMAVFLILWTPCQVVKLIEFIDSIDGDPWVEKYLMLLEFANSGVIPWIYAYNTKDFRSALGSLLPMRTLKPNVRPYTRKSSVLSYVSVFRVGAYCPTINNILLHISARYHILKHDGQRGQILVTCNSFITLRFQQLKTVISLRLTFKRLSVCCVH